MRASPCLEIVKKFPGLTATELSKHVGLSPASSAAALFKLVEQGKVVRVQAPGMNPAKPAYRYYLPPTLRCLPDLPDLIPGTAQPNRRLETFTVRLHTYTELPARPNTFPELVELLLPNLTEAEIKQILTTAACHRLRV